MNILAIDTTTKKANVGIKTKDIIKIKSIDNDITHSEKLLPLIDEVLTECNITIKDIECIACTTGPGSFTGIRIGLATVKALSKVIKSKIYNIDSLELLARSTNSLDYKLVISLVDAKNNRAYAGMYLKESNLQTHVITKNKYIKEILEDISIFCGQNNIQPQDVLVVADTINVLEAIPDIYGKKLSSLNIEVLLNLASNSSNFTNYLKLDATYVRSSEAERTKYGE